MDKEKSKSVQILQEVIYSGDEFVGRICGYVCLQGFTEFSQESAFLEGRWLKMLYNLSKKESPNNNVMILDSRNPEMRFLIEL